jgi:hypothetical protein
LVPTLAQLPLQHWSFVKQTSFTWTQNETAFEQPPPRHSFEQQSFAVAHGFPAILQVPPPPTGAHRLLVQTPLQQSELRVQAPGGLSATHGFVAHWRFDPQKPVQQSAPDRQASPGLWHGPPVEVLQTLGWEAPQTPPFGHAPEPTPHGTTPPQPSGM